MIKDYPEISMLYVIQFQSHERFQLNYQRLSAKDNFQTQENNYLTFLRYE